MVRAPLHLLGSTSHFLSPELINCGSTTLASDWFDCSFQHLPKWKEGVVGCFGGITSLQKLSLLIPSLLTTDAHIIEYWSWKELRNHLVQPLHLIDKKTEVQRDEEAYSTLHDKLAAEPGPEPSNISLFPVFCQLKWASVLGYSQGKKTSAMGKWW